MGLSLSIGTLLLSATSAQRPPRDPVIAAVEPLLRSASAVLRGEAALVLASTGKAKYYASIFEMAGEANVAARHRAILALGYLKHPGADALLGKILRKAPKDSADRLLASMALGLLPDDPRVPAVDHFFNRVSGASRKRIQDQFVSMLLGLLHAPHPHRMTVLRDLLANAAYRRSPVLPLVIANLAQVPSPENTAVFFEQLPSGNPRTMTAALAGLTTRGARLSMVQRRSIVKLAEHHCTARVRAAALQLLTLHRDPQALAIAGRELGSGDPDRVAAAIHTILRLGGGSLRKDLEDRILATEAPGLQTRMLSAKTAPHGDEFVAGCIEIATNSRKDFTLRAAAAAVAAEAGRKQITPTAINLFLEAGDADSLGPLAEALAALDVDIRDKIRPARRIRDAALLPQRLRALLGARHRQGVEMVLDILKRPRSGADLELVAVRAYRLTRLERLPASALRMAPRVLAELLE